MRAASILAMVALLGCGGKPPGQLTADQLLDPQTCASCHAQHYADWAASAHAHASDDPVFLAMNRRGQRETGGALGSFCVNCHAPLAVRKGATRDGLNLASVDSRLKGVTCFFCHTVDGVQGAHDAPLHLADDGVMRAAYADPIAATPHGAAYGALQDRNQLGSAALCGACHDIVSPHGAAIERTFAEWQHSAFSQAPGGTTCGQCHMPQSAQLQPIASVSGAPARRVHSHAFAAVDLALGADAGDGAAKQRQLVQDFLDSTVQAALCVRTLGGKSQVQLILDNVAAGHGFPSGSAQDRRFWAEITASADGGTLYQSGAVPDGGAVTSLEDVWLLRDCMFDEGGAQVSMFWNAASTEGNELPGQATFDPADSRYYQSHVVQTYPLSGEPLAAAPEVVTARLHLQPIGADVLLDLVASGDLDPALAAEEPTLSVGAPLTWTAATATDTFVDPGTGAVLSCVSRGLNPRAQAVPAAANVHCSP